MRKVESYIPVLEKLTQKAVYQPCVGILASSWRKVCKTILSTSKPNS